MAVDSPAAAPRRGAQPPLGEERATTVFYHPGGAAPKAEGLQGYEFVDEPGLADVVIVSTRSQRSELPSLVPRLVKECGGPVVALTHTGGEATAVEIMRHGASGVIAEGNEAALDAFLTGGSADSDIVEMYERRLGGADGTPQKGRARDEATGLPSGDALEERLAEFGQGGELPRLGLLRVLHLEPTAHRLAGEAVDVLRRRLATQYRALTQVAGAELFVLDEMNFAVVAPGLSSQRVEQLGGQLAQVSESFAPTGHQTLKLAMGHAGPEVAAEVATLRELAARALGAAVAERDGTVIGADALSLGLASTTELEAALRTVDAVEVHDAHQPGHGARVAELAAELAWRLGYEGVERSRIRLAAHVHDIGKVALPTAAIGGPDGCENGLLEAYRSHPQRGAALVRVSAGPQVAEAIGAHHERWDGAGFPDGLAGESIPIAARIIAVANAFDRRLHPAEPPDGTAPTVDAALETLQQSAASRLDPTLVTAAIDVFPGIVASRAARQG